MTTSATSREALSLVVALHRLVRSLRHTSKAAGLQPTQLVVLSQLMESGPMRIGELAVRVPCSQPTATTVVTSLETAGLVRREPDPADGRATRVLITDEGRTTIISVAHGEAELLSERMARLPEAERAALANLTPVLRHLAEIPAS
ncbi:MarR family winged helix-turn-helix transcriptional regulator [Goodfellowiella coeruleoviolacea]|uniref:DNA-binding transcriptional regulator, MarR family n=1 Tax=Goodfellowiella coeruleoviolacea TaxID=334858 RepID=A0AAE3GN57_9PSEU|nr:MarR family transcriptional regulator [Goodfellowiella coeruleoviolacea]MCP2170319.1 DNA-binding transcriptional regulator, MarR family [Goodfellowiella coeruleoviolacea]